MNSYFLEMSKCTSAQAQAQQQKLSFLFKNYHNGTLLKTFDEHAPLHSVQTVYWTNGTTVSRTKKTPSVWFYSKSIYKF